MIRASVSQPCTVSNFRFVPNVINDVTVKKCLMCGFHKIEHNLNLIPIATAFYQGKAKSARKRYSWRCAKVRLIGVTALARRFNYLGPPIFWGPQFSGAPNFGGYLSAKVASRSLFPKPLTGDVCGIFIFSYIAHFGKV